MLTIARHSLTRSSRVMHSCNERFQLMQRYTLSLQFALSLWHALSLRHTLSLHTQGSRVWS